MKPAPDRQRAQALPGHSGVLPTRARRGGTGSARPDLANVMLNAGLQPVREDDEVAPLNSYLRWLPCCYNPGKDRRRWYTQPMFAQHAANLSPVWGRAQGTGHPGITMFTAAAARLRSTLEQVGSADECPSVSIWPHRLGEVRHAQQPAEPGDGHLPAAAFIVEAGNSFGLFSDFARRLGLTVNRVKLAPDRASAWRRSPTHAG